MLRTLIFLSAFSQVFLPRFGLNIIQDFSLSLSYFFLYGALATAIIQGMLVLSPYLLISFLFLCFSTLCSFLLGVPEKTASSMLLLLFIYLPFIFQPVSTSAPDKGFFRLYFKIVLILGLAGVGQFFAQFLTGPQWLFDFRPLIPDLFRNLNVMNTIIPFGSVIKSNGFFQLEPSFFSQWMAVGIYFFGFMNTSFFSFFIFLTGLTVSFSGTGLILIFFICLFSFQLFEQKRRWILLSSFSVFLLFGVFFPDSFLKTRTEEFKGGAGVRTTSAAARFVTPFFTLEESFKNSPQRIFFGNGPGTITKVARDFEAHDPVWAKLFFEYGLVGGASLVLFLALSISRAKQSFTLTFLFCIQWFFLGGHLLSFDIVAFYVIYYKLASFY